MKRIIAVLLVSIGLAFGHDGKSNNLDEREVKLSRLEWKEVQRGMSVSNRYYFAEHKVELVITNKVDDTIPITIPPYRPIGRGAERIEPQDYVK